MKDCYCKCGELLCETNGDVDGKCYACAYEAAAEGQRKMSSNRFPHKVEINGVLYDVPPTASIEELEAIHAKQISTLTAQLESVKAAHLELNEKVSCAVDDFGIVGEHIGDAVIRMRDALAAAKEEVVMWRGNICALGASCMKPEKFVELIKEALPSEIVAAKEAEIAHLRGDIATIESQLAAAREEIAALHSRLDNPRICKTCGFDKHPGCCTNLLCPAYGKLP